MVAFLSFFLLSCSCSATHSGTEHSPQTQNRYADIEDYYTKMVKPAKKTAESTAEKDPFTPLITIFHGIPELFKKSTFTLPQASPQTLTFAAVQQIKKLAGAADATPTTKVLSPTAWENLDLFTNGARITQKTVVESINRTRTVAGKVVLTRLLLDPLTDKNAIKKRQDFVRKLVDKAPLFDEFDNSLKALAKDEQSFMGFINPQDFINNPSILNIYDPLVTIAKTPSARNAYFGFSSFAINAGTAFIALIATLHSTFALLPPRAYARIGLPSLNPLPRLGLGAAAALYVAMNLGAWGTLKHEGKIPVQLQRRLSSLKIFFATADDIADFCVNSGIEDLEKEANRYKKEYRKSLKPLITSLEKKRFNRRKGGGFQSNHRYMHSNQADVPNAFIEAKAVLPTILSGLTLIGYIDAFVGLARLIKESTPQKPYCFVDLLDEESPRITAINFHHPVVASEKTVTNSIRLGGTTDPGIAVITGVNAGGKSTIMKALALCCVLGQVAGIAPAKSCSFTPFSFINTYLNITDDASKGHSLFMAELKRAQTLLNQTKSLAKNEFSFTLLDEIFTGTERFEGEALAYAVAKKLSLAANNLSVIATHFPGLIKLATDDPGHFKNLHVQVTREPDGSFSYPYLLLPGSIEQNIAPDLLEKEGLPLVMANAMRDMLQNPSSYTVKD